MEESSDDLLLQGRAALDAGRFAEGYQYLLPLAEAGLPEAQAQVGMLMAPGLHCCETAEQAADLAPSSWTTIQSDRERAADFLRAASDRGIGAATFDFATMILTGGEESDWADRKAQASDLFVKAQNQGFTAFAWLTNGEEPGQPYCRILEQAAGRDSVR